MTCIYAYLIQIFMQAYSVNIHTYIHRYFLKVCWPTQDDPSSIDAHGKVHGASQCHLGGLSRAWRQLEDLAERHRPGREICVGQGAGRAPGHNGAVKLRKLVEKLSTTGEEEHEPAPLTSAGPPPAPAEDDSPTESNHGFLVGMDESSFAGAWHGDGKGEPGEGSGAPDKS